MNITINIAIAAVVVAITVVLLFNKHNSGEKTPVKGNKVLIVAGAAAAISVIVGAIMFVGIGAASVGATRAGKEYLQQRYGPSDVWTIRLTDHVVSSKKPKAGCYTFHYRYAGYEGDLVAEYSEQQTGLSYKITSKDK